jgi:DNA-binding LytR/AlgR family response regulator
MKILICDSDFGYVAECKSHLFVLAEKHKTDITVETVESGNSLLFFKDTKYSKIDLIYIAYSLSGLNGIETARELRRSGVTADIVFCTDDAAHAIDGYDVDALSYILKKNLTDKKFEDIFLKAMSRCKKRDKELMTFSHCNEHRVVRIDDILYFEVHNRTVTVNYLKDNETENFDFNSSLSKIEQQLEGKGFERNHGSFLVSTRYIHKATASQLEMINGDVLPIGKSHHKKRNQFV